MNYIHNHIGIQKDKLSIDYYLKMYQIHILYILVHCLYLIYKFYIQNRNKYIDLFQNLVHSLFCKIHILLCFLLNNIYSKHNYLDSLDINLLQEYSHDSNNKYHRKNNIFHQKFLYSYILYNFHQNLNNIQNSIHHIQDRRLMNL